MELGNDSSGHGRAPLKKMIVPLVILGVVVVVILGGIFAWHLFMGKMMAKYMGAAATAPQTVSTVVAGSASWQARRWSVRVRSILRAPKAMVISGSKVLLTSWTICSAARETVRAAVKMTTLEEPSA